MLDVSASPPRFQTSGLCEDATGESTALIRRMARGDRAALVELHASWSPVLLGVAARIFGERREADELLHRTFVTLWRRAGSFDPHLSPPFVWAMVLMRGMAVEQLRRGRTNRDARHTSAANRWENPKPLSNDDCARLKSAIDQLDPEDLACLESAVFLEYARSDRSDAFTVKNRLRRALDHLRKSLSRHEL